MVRVRGLEPPRLSAYEPKSHAAANYATPAFMSPLIFDYRRNGALKPPGENTLTTTNALRLAGDEGLEPPTL